MEGGRKCLTAPRQKWINSARGNIQMSRNDRERYCLGHLPKYLSRALPCLLLLVSLLGNQAVVEQSNVEQCAVAVDFQQAKTRQMISACWWGGDRGDGMASLIHCLVQGEATFKQRSLAAQPTTLDIVTQLEQASRSSFSLESDRSKMNQ